MKAAAATLAALTALAILAVVFQGISQPDVELAQFAPSADRLIRPRILENVNRTYVMLQNDHANHPIKVGFATNTVAPTVGFDIAGSAKEGDIDTKHEFSVAPINAVWAKVLHGQDHLIQVVYDD